MHTASSAVAHLRHADSKEHVESLQSVVAPRRQPNIFRALLTVQGITVQHNVFFQKHIILKEIVC